MSAFIIPGKYFLLQKIDLINLFHQILSSRLSPSFNELTAFIKFATRSFLKKLEERPKLYLEVFFPKSRNDICAIENQIQPLSEDEIDIDSSSWTQKLGLILKRIPQDLLKSFLEVSIFFNSGTRTFFRK
jgi:hypothetical protein